MDELYQSSDCRRNTHVLLLLLTVFQCSLFPAKPQSKNIPVSLMRARMTGGNYSPPHMKMSHHVNGPPILSCDRSCTHLTLTSSSFCCVDLIIKVSSPSSGHCTASRPESLTMSAQLQPLLQN